MLKFQETTDANETLSVRFDAQTAERVVALAARMQAEHQETLSAGEIEKIAAEAGIEPRFIQQAITAVGTDARAATQTTQTPLSVQAIESASTRTKSRQRRGLSGWQKFGVFGVPVLYSFTAAALLTNALAARFADSDKAAYAELMHFSLTLIVPAILTLLIGATLPRKRQGAITGALLGFGVYIADRIATGFIYPEAIYDVWPILPLWIGGGMIAGFAGAWLRNNAGIWPPGEESEKAENSDQLPVER